MQMQLDPKRTSAWMIEFDKAISCCQCPILHGNCFDKFLCNGEYISMGEFIQEYFSALDFSIIGDYNLADGLNFKSPNMKDLFEKSVAFEMGTEEATTDGSSYLDSVVVNNEKTLFLQDPVEAITQMRSVLEQKEAINSNKTDIKSAAFQINYVDRLQSSGETQSQLERQWQILVLEAMQNATFILDENQCGLRNTLVLTAKNIGFLPRWLIADNPFIKVIPISLPSREERMMFVVNFWDNFYRATELSEELRKKAFEDFADLTDGLQMWQLDSIMRTSLTQEIPAKNMKKLIMFFKHGNGDDLWEKINDKKIQSATESINNRLYGQEVAVESVMDMLISARVGINTSPSQHSSLGGKPKGVFFFVGPTGVGKTELAKSLAEAVFGDESAFARFDMSEYSEQHAAEKLAGAPPGFVGYEEGGHLTNRILQRPFSLLLFDEIEKAHPRVLDKFLQILEDGRLTDGHGQTAFFGQSVIIFTSNLGSSTMSEFTEKTPYNEIQEHFVKAVRDHFVKPPKMDGTGGIGRPELFNRLGEGVIVFDVLRSTHVIGIANKFLRLLAESAKEKCKINLVFDGSINQWIIKEMLKKENQMLGGRRVRIIVEEYIQKQINKWVFLNNPAKGSTINVAVNEQSKDFTLILKCD